MCKAVTPTPAQREEYVLHTHVIKTAGRLEKQAFSITQLPNAERGVTVGWGRERRAESREAHNNPAEARAFPHLLPAVHISLTLHRTDNSLHFNHQIWTFEINAAVHVGNKNK